MVLKLVFFGIQGSGKGTQAKIIAAKHRLCHISTGDLFRGASGEFKKEIDSHINFGKLVPDELTLKMLKKRLEEKDCENGFILDGFPRNIEQARELDKIIKIDNAFNIEISDEEARKRMKGRWNCKKCGIAYNIATEPKPKQEGICDKCSEKLVQRNDDVSDEAISKRLEIYHTETRPVLKFYNTIKINGEQPIGLVTLDIEKAIKMIMMFR